MWKKEYDIIREKVNKGEIVYAGREGTACATSENGSLIVGVALESNASASEKLVECILKV